MIRSVPISSRNMKYHFSKDTRQQNTARVTKEFWSEINYQMEQINKWFKLLQTPPICYFYMSDDVELSHGQDVVLAFVLKDTNHTRCTFAGSFSSHLKIFHSFGTITIAAEGLQILT